MTATTLDTQAAAQMAELDDAISAKLDFVFSYSDEESLLTLRSVLGFVRRLLRVKAQFDPWAEETVRIPLKREPKCIGASLKVIIEDADYTYSVQERTGYSIVALNGLTVANIDSLIASCLVHVETELATIEIKYA